MGRVMTSSHTLHQRVPSGMPAMVRSAGSRGRSPVRSRSRAIRRMSSATAGHREGPPRASAGRSLPVFGARYHSIAENNSASPGRSSTPSWSGSAPRCSRGDDFAARVLRARLAIENSWAHAPRPRCSLVRRPRVRPARLPCSADAVAGGAAGGGGALHRKQSAVSDDDATAA